MRNYSCITALIVRHVTGIPLDTLYHDMKNQFMLFFSFFKEDDFDYKPMDMKVPKSMMKGDYTFRMVFGSDATQGENCHS